MRRPLPQSRSEPASRPTPWAWKVWHPVADHRPIVSEMPPRRGWSRAIKPYRPNEPRLCTRDGPHWWLPPRATAFGHPQSFRKRHIPRRLRRLLQNARDAVAQLRRQMLCLYLLRNLGLELGNGRRGQLLFEQSAGVLLEDVGCGDQLGDTVDSELPGDEVDQLARRHRIEFDPLML